MGLGVCSKKLSKLSRVPPEQAENLLVSTSLFSGHILISPEKLFLQRTKINRNICEETDYKESAHTVTEAEKSHDLLFISCQSRIPRAVLEGLRTAED